jgi:putative aminopeptidase FrvX
MSSLEKDSLNLLRELSEAFRPSGFEREPLGIVKRAGSSVSDEIPYDRIGSIIFKKKGTSDTPGKGPSILTFDASMIPNQEFKRFVIDTAEEEKIPLQLSVVTKGGTDAGRFSLNKAGCSSIVIGVPTRHIHSHESIVDTKDIDNAVKLMLALVKRLDAKTVKSFTQS